MTAELWHAGSPVLFTHDLVASAGFWGSLGFAIELADPHLHLTLGGVALTYAESDRIDPWSEGLQVVDVEVTNADLLHAELYEADVMPDSADDDAADDEVRARWESTRDVSRLGPVVEAGGRRGFTIHDPSGNAVRCGHGT